MSDDDGKTSPRDIEPAARARSTQGPLTAVDAQARVHHACLLGLQLMVATREGPAAVGEWMFRLFRRQHHEKFLSSFAKLGLTGLPHAVACARYHVLSNAIGGVDVEYMEESDRKAWVRFRYPRWMYAGPVICGVPVEASRGFLEGWYAHNGVSLGNPRLRFVCVSEDMTGEYGLCGYFEECGRDLGDDERLLLAKDELPPPFDPARQPRPPAAEWSEERLRKANRNYAIEYVRNGVCELATTVGDARAAELAGQAARLIGLQYYRETAASVGASDGGADRAADYLCRMMAGLDDDAYVEPGATEARACVRHRGLRVLRGLAADERSLLLGCWQQLWLGAVRAHGPMLQARVERRGSGAGEELAWTIELEPAIALPQTHPAAPAPAGL